MNFEDDPSVELSDRCRRDISAVRIGEKRDSYLNCAKGDLKALINHGVGDMDDNVKSGSIDAIGRLAVVTSDENRKAVARALEKALKYEPRYEEEGLWETGGSRWLAAMHLGAIGDAGSIVPIARACGDPTPIVAARSVQSLEMLCKRMPNECAGNDELWAEIENRPFLLHDISRIVSAPVEGFEAKLD